jgi:hypothetical protein
MEDGDEARDEVIRASDTPEVVEKMVDLLWTL